MGISYEEIGKRLMSVASRKRDMKQLEAQAEIKTIQREYEAYTDGVLDAVKAIKQEVAKDGAGNG